MADADADADAEEGELARFAAAASAAAIRDRGAAPPPPRWAARLHALGVDASSLTIAFREYLPEGAAAGGGDAARGGAPPSRSGPTLLRCVMEITLPVALTAISRPFGGKRGAMEDAVDLIEADLPRHVGGAGLRRIAERRRRLRAAERREEERRLSACVPSTATYAFPLPDYCVGPMAVAGASPRSASGGSERARLVENEGRNLDGVADGPAPPCKGKRRSDDSAVPNDRNSSAGATSSAVLYLYELSFVSESGGPFVSERMNLDPCSATRLGIVFSSDILETGEADVPLCGNGGSAGSGAGPDAPAAPTDTEFKSIEIEADFQLQGQNGRKENVTVRLSNRTVLSFGVDAASKLSNMRRFNKAIHSWKTYGFGQKRETLEYVTPDSLPASSRTYMFVPLMEQIQSRDTRAKARSLRSDCPMDVNEGCLSINWNLLHRISTHETVPFVLSLDAKWLSLPLVGRIDLVFLSWTSLLLAITTIAPWFSFGTKALSDWEVSFCFVLVTVSFVAFAAQFAPPKEVLQRSLLKNRFLRQQKPARQALYVLHDVCQYPSGQQEKDPKKTAKSALLSPEEVRDLSETEGTTQKFGLDMSKCTFADYYWKRYGIRLRHVNDALLPAHVVKKHTDWDTLSVESCCSSAGGSDRGDVLYIIPELVRVLPMPRDALYILRRAPVFMLPLERSIALSCFEQRLAAMGQQVDLGVPKSFQRGAHKSAPMPLPHPLLVRNQRSMTSLIAEATTLTPCTYERLEFLGDRVLEYFVAINLMARNHKLNWDSDTLSNLKHEAVKNEALFEAALRIGLNKMLLKDPGKWTSAFGASEKMKQIHEVTDEELALSHYRHHAVEVSERVLSDVTESLLAAAFMKGGKSGSIVIGLLEELKLPMPEDRERKPEAGWPWFRALSPCLDSGYPYELDKPWNQQLINIGTVIYTDHEVNDRLERGWDQFMKSMASSNIKSLEAQPCKILLFCALFDDSLEYGGSSLSSKKSSLDVSIERGSVDASFDRNSVDLSFEKKMVDSSINDSLEDSFTELEGLERVAALREVLYFVGNSALSLCLSSDLYQRYCDASPGDMHLLLCCAASKDVLAYIMVKNKLHECMYDQDAEDVSIFCSQVLLADEIGSRKWDKNGGWVVSGGINEFRRRWKACHPRGNAETFLPQYAGLNGGRLHGHEGKISEELTENLAFSMKAIVGALVLSIGLDGMWHCLCPLFEEALLLSASECRRVYGNTSTLFQFD